MVDTGMFNHSTWLPGAKPRVSQSDFEHQSTILWLWWFGDRWPGIIIGYWSHHYGLSTVGFWMVVIQVRRNLTHGNFIHVKGDQQTANCTANNCWLANCWWADDSNQQVWRLCLLTFEQKALLLIVKGLLAHIVTGRQWASHARHYTEVLV